jgi:hypothetical protein
MVRKVRKFLFFSAQNFKRTPNTLRAETFRVSKKFSLHSLLEVFVAHNKKRG